MAAQSIVVPKLKDTVPGIAAWSGAKRIETVSPTILGHVKTIFNAVSGGDNGLDGSEAARFLEAVQGLDVSQARSVFPDRDVLSLHEFLQYITSPEFSAMGPPPVEALSYPISNYFVSSSHNTYLLGNQLFGQSSTDGYKIVWVPEQPILPCQCFLS